MRNEEWGVRSEHWASRIEVRGKRGFGAFSKFFLILVKLIPDKKTTKLETKGKQSNNKTLYRVLLLLCLYFIISLLLL